MEHWKNLQKESLDGEVWKDIEGFEGFYKVSNYGRVKSLARKSGKYISKHGKTVRYTVSEKILKQSPRSNGYLRVLLVKKEYSIRNSISVHRLILMSFKPHQNQANLYVNHLDGNKKENSLDNLEWTTPKENVKHAFETGLSKYKQQNGEENHMAILKSQDVIYIYTNPDNLEAKELSEKLGIKKATIYSIWRDENWKFLTKDYTKNKIEGKSSNNTRYKIYYEKKVFYVENLKNFLSENSIPSHRAYDVLNDKIDSWNGWGFKKYLMTNIYKTSRNHEYS